MRHFLLTKNDTSNNTSDNAKKKKKNPSKNIKENHFRFQRLFLVILTKIFSSTIYIIKSNTEGAVEGKKLNKLTLYGAANV